MKIRLQIAYIAISVTYLVVIAITLGACQPFNHYWQINPDPGGRPPTIYNQIPQSLTISLLRSMHACCLLLEVLRCRCP
jgi:hypothetical protein